MSPELVDIARADLSADGVPADHLAVTSGALDGIERALTAHLRPGDRVAVEDPGWANLLDLLAALGLSAEPVRVDDEGPLVARHGPGAAPRRARGGRHHSRAKPDRGRAVERNARRSAQPAGRHDRRRAARRGRPLRGHFRRAAAHAWPEPTRHWAFVRSASKAYGPDLRVAVLAGDRRTVERVHGRLRLGPGWVSHLLQDLAVGLWSDDAATDLVWRGRRAIRQATARVARRLGRARRGRARRGPASTSGSRCPTRPSRSPGCSARVGPRRREHGSGFAPARDPHHHRRPDRRRDRAAGRRDRRGHSRHRTLVGVSGSVPDEQPHEKRDIDDEVRYRQD